MNCPHLQALFQVGVFFCMNLNQPHCKKKHMWRIGASRIFARPNNWLLHLRCFNMFLFTIPPKYVQKRYPPSLHKFFTKSRNCLVEHPPTFGWAFHPNTHQTKSSHVVNGCPLRFGSWAPWMARRNYASVHRSRCQTLQGCGGVVRWRFMIFMMRWKNMWLVLQWFLKVVYIHVVDTIELNCVDVFFQILCIYIYVYIITYTDSSVSLFIV